MNDAALAVLTRLVLPLTVAGAAVAVPAQAAGPDGASPAPRIIAPVAGMAPSGPHAAAVAGKASATCVTYATQAGWANNGYYSGDLVTAAAICVAESTGQPKLYVCDENGVAIAHGYYNGKVTCPAGFTSYDRGLWQLSNKFDSQVSDKCAFDPVCNAGQAYLASGRGTDFAPWSSYDQDIYARFIDPVQAAVSALGSGTVTSALLGECLARAAHTSGAKVVIADCGSGSSKQEWSITRGKLRAGPLCAAIAATGRRPSVLLRPCARTRTQSWAPFGGNELRNAADGKCLTDPGNSLTAGTQVDVTRCRNAKNQTWWLP